MASPAVVGTPTETAISTAGTSHVVNLPSGASGNLLLAIMDKGSTAATVGSLAGWNELLDENSANGLYIAWRVADGTEGATTTFTLSASTRGAWIVYEISGAADPTIRAPEIGTTASGSSTAPNPPSVSVTGGSRDVLTIAAFGRGGEEADDDTWVTSAPSGFGTLLQIACGTVGTNLGGMLSTAHLQQTTATADPAAFTCATGAWRAQTIVVHPKPTQTSVAEVSLAAAGTPTTQTAHSIKVRARVTSGSGTIRAALYEGANNRSGDLESSALTTSLADYSLAIADASAANITDYSNLSIRFWGYSVNGGGIVFEVDQIYLETPASTGATGSSTFPITFTVGSAGTPKAYGASTSAFTFGVVTAGKPTAYGVSATPITVTVGAAGTSLPKASSTVPITFTVGSAGTPKAYGASTSSFTFGVSSSGTPKAYGVSAVPITFGVVSSASAILHRSSDSTYTVGISSDGTPTAYGVSAVPVTFGVSSSGTAAASPRIAAAGLVYLFGDLDGAGVFGFSEVDITFGVSSSGTPKAYGAATTPIGVNISSAGSVPGSGSATTDFTFGVSSSGTPKAYGSSTVAITVAVVSAGSFIPTASSTLPITFGVSSTGTPTVYAASATVINFNVDSYGVGEITIGMFDDTGPTASSYDEPSPSGSHYDAPALTGAMYDEPTPS
jgi:hypothetical protein